MANRYWVGGTGNWDGTTTHWAASSGGAAGASTPLSTDNVFFDANSGGGTITLSNHDPGTGLTSGPCQDFTNTGFTGSFTGTSLNTTGNLVLGKSISIQCSMRKTSGISTIKSNNFATGLLTLGSGGGTATFRLLDDYNSPNSQIIVSAGTFDANNFNVTATSFSLAAGSSANMGSGTWTLRGAGTCWAVNSAASLNAGTSTIKLTNATSSIKDFGTGGKTYNKLWITGTGTGKYTISKGGSVTAATFDEILDDKTVAHTVQVEVGLTLNVTTFNVNGSTGKLVSLVSSSAGTQFTLSKSSGTVTCNYLAIQDCVATGGATWQAFTSTNNGNNTGWTFVLTALFSEQVIVIGTMDPFANLKTITLSTITVISDSVSKVAGRAFGETSVVRDAFSAIKVAVVALPSEVLSVVDAVIKGPYKNLEQTILVIDSIIRTAGRTLGEALSAVDNIMLNSVLYRSLAESISSSDAFSISRNIFASFLETLRLSDIVIFTKRLIGKILGVDNDTNIKVGIAKTAILGIDTDSGIMVGRKTESRGKSTDTNIIIGRQI